MARRTPTLKRRRYVREPKRRFFLFCEGKKTEPTYFAALRHEYRDALILIETNPGVGVPLTVACAAARRVKELGLAHRSRKSLSSFEKGDEVWAVFDRDDHPNFTKAVALCESRGVRCARSNPCFEVWLILHERDYDRPDGRFAVQAHLKRIRPEYSPKDGKVPNCADLIRRVEKAEQRAETQLTRRNMEGASYGVPSTTVGRLTRAIREAADRAR